MPEIRPPSGESNKAAKRAWLEALANIPLAPPEDESTAAEDEGLITAAALAGTAETEDDSPEVDQSEAGEADVTASALTDELVTGPGDGGDSTLTMDDPIGVLTLLDFAPQGGAGQGFNATVAKSPKDALLFAAVTTAVTIRTVKVKRPGTNLTLQNVLITFLGDSADKAGLEMTLNPGAPEKPDTSKDSTLTMDEPIGVLPLISATEDRGDGSGVRQFNVVVASTAKDPLLFAAAASGVRLQKVEINLRGRVTTLRQVLVNSLSPSGNSTLNMSLLNNG